MSNPLDEIRDDVERKLQWLFGEVDKLRWENRHLQKENKTLRQQVTQLQMDRQANRSAEAAASAAEPFYHLLPASFTFSQFFELAEQQGVGGDQAKQYLLHFIRQEMLLQKGPRIIKPERLGRLPRSQR